MVERALRINLKKEVYDPESAVQDELLFEVIHRILERIPGVKEAVILEAHKQWGDADMSWLKNDQLVESLDGLPFMYIWATVFNQEE